MGCCQSRLKDTKQKSNCIDPTDEFTEVNNGSISEMIVRNKKKRIKSFIGSGQERRTEQNEYT